ESSPQVDAELTLRHDDDPPKAIARSASPAMAPGRPRVAPEPTLAFTTAVAPLRLTFATGPATLIALPLDSPRRWYHVGLPPRMVRAYSPRLPDPDTVTCTVAESATLPNGSTARMR